MSENRTGKYFKYAAGEILLVVIGILIALSINNWNEKRQDLMIVDRLFDEVLEEIQLNVQECEKVIQYEKARDSIIQLLLIGKIDKQDYKDNPSLGTTVLYSFDIDTDNRAFLNLSKQSELIPTTSLEMFSDLEWLYNDPIEELRKWNTRVAENALRNSRNWSEKHNWFTSVWSEVYSEIAIDYFLNSPLYLNEVSYYYTFHQMQMFSAKKFIRYGVEFYKNIYTAYYPGENLPDWIYDIKSIKLEQNE